MESYGAMEKRQPFTITVGVPLTPKRFPDAIPSTMAVGIACRRVHRASADVSATPASWAIWVHSLRPRESCDEKTDATNWLNLPCVRAHSAAFAAGIANRCCGSGKCAKCILNFSGPIESTAAASAVWNRRQNGHSRSENSTTRTLSVGSESPIMPNATDFQL